jgi:ABC-type uncharacterized transport system substrate-binding protein
LGDESLRAAYFVGPLTALALACLPSAGALAHPHVWVTVKSTIAYDNGAITGLQQSWTFDEFYTATAIEGLDANGDGKYDREELTELAQVNIDGLKEFDYFTHAKLGDGALKFKAPVDYWLEHTDKGILTLHFTLPLEQAVLAEAPAFTFSIYDPSYFIAFTLAEKQPIRLGAGAPAGCTAAVHDPLDDDEPTEADKLKDAFSGVLDATGTVDVGNNQTVTVECAKS